MSTLCRSRFGFAVLATLGAMLGWTNAGWAQAPAARSRAPVAVDESGYKVMVPTKTLSTNKVEELRYRNLVQDVLKGKLPLAENQARFDSYYTWFSFPSMTQTTPEAFKELPERRNRFFRVEVEIATDPQAHAHLMDLTLVEMLNIVQDKYHPAVRYNAMLIISSLNDQEVVRTGADKRVPEPMARALPFILAEFQKPENSDAVKVAALIGLSRHLEWDPHRAQDSQPIPAPLRTQIVNALLAVLQAKDPPAGRDAAGHIWFRRRAAEALGFACYGKYEAPVAEALDQIFRDGSEPIDLRCTAATALGPVNFQAPAKLDTLATVKELGYLALVACDSELNRVNALKETETERAARLSGQFQGGSGGGDFGGGDISSMPDAPSGGAGVPPGMIGPPGGALGGFGAGGAAAPLFDAKGYRFDYIRRRIRQQLYCVQFALTGGDEFDPTRPPVAATPGLENTKMPPRGMNAYVKAGEEKKYLNEVYARVRELAYICENKAVDTAMLDKELRKTMKGLEAITKKLAPPPAPPAGVVSPDAPVAGKLPPGAPGVIPADAPAAPAAAPAAVPGATPPAGAGAGEPMPAPAPPMPVAAGGAGVLPAATP